MALRLAARASERKQAEDLETLRRVCKMCGVPAAVAKRAEKLLSRELPEEDRDQQSLEDATALVTLLTQLPQLGEEPSKTALPSCWRRMSPQAKRVALGWEYSGETWCALLQVIAAAEGRLLHSTECVPSLLDLTVKKLQSSFDQVRWQEFNSKFCSLLLQEHPDFQDLLASPAFQGSALLDIIGFILQLLRSKDFRMFDRVMRALAATAHIAGVRLFHLAAVKDALVTAISELREPVEGLDVSRIWNSFFYTCAAVVAPILVTEDRLEEFVAATASALPTPGGGPHAALAAVHGTALMRMCIKISISNGAAIPDDMLLQLEGNSQGLIQCARDDANAYCGYLAAIYASLAEDDPERLRWLKRACEVPISVAEFALKTGTACLHWKRHIKQTLRGDWIAGGKLLRTGLEISLKNVSTNLRSLGTNRFKEISERLAQLREYEPPWEDLLDLPP